MIATPQLGRIMFAHAPAFLVTLALLTGPVSAIAQQGPRIDALTGEPIKPRAQHPRAEPDIFNAPHAPRQEQRRADDPPIEIYVSPQMDNGVQQDPRSNPYATRRPSSHPDYDRRMNDPYRR